MKNHNPFRHFKTSPEVIRLAILNWRWHLDEVVMSKFRLERTLQKFTGIHASVYNHINHQRI